jgi:hypothetical protein
MPENTEHQAASDGAPAKHEVRDVNLRAVVGIVVGVVVLTLLGVVVSLGVYDLMSLRWQATEPPPPPMVETLPALPPEPRLQVTPAADLGKIRAEEDAVLSTYGWIDEQGGIVRIPIERAMELLVERGLPARVQPADARAANGAKE